MELQRNTQSLIAHASAARAGAAGTQTEGAAPEAAALLLWPSVRATQGARGGRRDFSVKLGSRRRRAARACCCRRLLARMSLSRMAARLAARALGRDRDGRRRAARCRGALNLLQKVAVRPRSRRRRPTRAARAATDRDATAADGLAAYRPPDVVPAPSAATGAGGRIPSAAACRRRRRRRRRRTRLEAASRWRALPEAPAPNHQRRNSNPHAVRRGGASLRADADPFEAAAFKIDAAADQLADQ